MRYATIRDMDITNGRGIGVSLFVQGCNNHCKDCFNKETWDFDGGEEFTKEVEETLYKLIDRDFVSRFSVLGGEALDEANVGDVLDIINNVNRMFPDKEIWLWTGYDVEDVMFGNITDRHKASQVLLSVDYVIDGRFDYKQRDLTIPFRGSRNQRLLSKDDIINIWCKGE